MYRSVLSRFHHENWPAPIFYLPVFLYYIYSSLKHGGRFNYFSVVNPGLKTGGLCAFSKWESYKLIEKKYVPETILLKKGNDLKTYEIIEQMNAKGLGFPVILKPDRGERGFLVHKIDSVKELASVLSQYSDKVDFLLQEFIEGDLELGVFIIKKTPSDWSISSLVSKKFLSVVGDGVSTVFELCQKDPRAEKFFLNRIKEEDLGFDKNKVLPLNEKMILEHIGNHCRGTEFVSEMQKNKTALKNCFSSVVESQTELNYFRLDLRAKSWEDIENGNFKVLEVNGVSAEPGHIYDPRLSLTEAYKDLFHHWMQMSEIAGEQLGKGLEPESITETVKEVLGHLHNKKTLMNLQKDEDHYLFNPPKDYESLKAEEVLELVKANLGSDFEVIFKNASDLGGYLRACLYKDESSELVLCKWKAGGTSNLHMHPQKDCWFEVLDGEIKEFRKLSGVTHELIKNQSGYIFDDHGPHKMFNDTQKDSISLHYYKKRKN